MSFITISRGKSFGNAALRRDADEIAEREAEIARRVRNELNKLRDTAEAQARALGDAALRAELAPQQAALANAAAAMQTAWSQLAAPLAQKEQDLAELALELAFILAGHIIGEAATTNPEPLRQLVTQLLAEAACERGPRQTLLIRVNPADQPQLAPHISGSANLLPDQSIAPGGALIEIVTPDGDPINKIEWDATLTGRLETLRQALVVQS